jgi:Tol biopolymer transport system component
MFCTACAAHNPRSVSRCRSCGAPLGPGTPPGVHARQRARTGIARILYILPVVALVLAALLGYGRYHADNASAAEAYARAEAALEVGQIEQAIDAFTEAGDFRDADGRRAEAIALLAPYRSAYLDGVAALDAGRNEDAITTLVPVVRDLPDYKDASTLLEEARRRLEDDLLHQADLAEAQRDWLTADRALATLAALDPENEPIATRLANLRRTHAPLVLTQEGALYLVGPDLADERLITDEVSASFPTWSPDRSQVAFLSPKPNDYSGRTQLYVIGVDGTGLELIAENVVLDGWPTWSPDGSKLAFTAYNSATPTGTRREPTVIRIADLTTGTLSTITSSELPYVSSPSWSPDGKRLAFVAKDPSRRGSGPGYRNRGDVYLYDVAGEEMTNLTEQRVPNADRVAWSPTEDRLLIFAVDRSTPWYERALTTITLLDLSTGAMEEYGNQSQSVGLPYWSPDGRAFAFLEGDQVIRIHWVESGEAWVNVSRPVASILTWAPDGAALIAIASDPRQPSSLIPLDNGPGPVTDLHLTFDLASPWIGPPQWAPVKLLEPPGPPTTSGTGLDVSR